MQKPTKYYKTVDEYIKDFPKEIAGKLKEMRALIKKAAPHAEESISYNIAGYKLNGILIYFAGFKSHIGLYPYKDSMNLTKAELEKYRKGKGTLQFPIDKKLPVGLIKRIVKIRYKEQLAKKAVKKKISKK